MCLTVTLQDQMALHGKEYRIITTKQHLQRRALSSNCSHASSNPVDRIHILCSPLPLTESWATSTNQQPNISKHCESGITNLPIFPILNHISPVIFRPLSLACPSNGRQTLSPFFRALTSFDRCPSSCGCMLPWEMIVFQSFFTG